MHGGSRSGAGVAAERQWDEIVAQHISSLHGSQAEAPFPHRQLACKRLCTCTRVATKKWVKRRRVQHAIDSGSDNKNVTHATAVRQTQQPATMLKTMRPCIDTQDTQASGHLKAVDRSRASRANQQKEIMTVTTRVNTVTTP